VVLTVIVREPTEHDDLSEDYTYQEYDDEWVDKHGRRVSVVVDFGNNRLVPYTGYVDLYGDGGTSLAEVPMILLYEAMLGAARATR
jgi:hypothetical protein